MIRQAIGKIQENPILKSSVAIGIMMIGAKVLGYGEKVTLAYFLGTSYQVDVYNVIITVILSVFIFFRELIEPAFLNTFLKAKNANDEQGAWSLFNTYIRYIIIVTVLLLIVVLLWPSYFVELLAPGFTGQKKDLAITLLQIAFPASIFLALSALTNITLNSFKKFAFPASGELVFKICIIGTLFLFFRYWGIYAAVIGFLLGAVCKLVTHLLLLFKRISFKAAINKPAYVKNVWHLSWPLLVGVAFSQVSSLIDNVFASSQQEGAIAALSYANKLIEFPVLIFPYILSVVVFPYFAEFSIAKQPEKNAQLLLQSLSWIIILFCPLSVFYYLLSHEMVDVVFKRGAFNEYSVLLTALPLKYYAIGLVFFAIETVLVVFYFANANTKAPIFIGILCVIEKIALTYIFIPWMGYAGIALAHVISKATKNIILLALLKRETGISLSGLFPLVYKVALATVLTAISIMGFKQVWLTYK
jgi:murein biosynthesis integral membrane protein MurJ